MFASRIRRMHWGWQLALWPLYGALWLMGRAARIALRLAVAAKKMPAPLLLLASVIAVTAALILVLGNALFAQILGPIMKVWVILAIAYFVVRTVISGMKP